MKNYRRILLIVLIIILFLLIGIMFWNYLKEKYGYDETLCYNHPDEHPFGTQKDSSIIDCRGYIYIEQDTKCSDDDIITQMQCGDKSIYDTKNSHYIVYKTESYKILDNIIYVVGKLAVDTLTYGDGEKDIYFPIKINGGFESIDFKNTEDVPKYIVVNSETSDIKLYKDYSEMPAEDRAVFEDLEGK